MQGRGEVSLQPGAADLVADLEGLYLLEAQGLGLQRLHHRCALGQARDLSRPDEHGALLYVGYTGAVPAFTEVVTRGIADGVLGMTPSAHMPDEKGRDFVEKWRKAYNEDPSLGIAAQIYDEVMFWAAAVEKVGSVDDYAAINEALRTMTYDGVTGLLKFNDEQFVNSTDEAAPAQILQVQDSKVVPIMIGSKIVAGFAKPAWFD